MVQLVSRHSCVADRLPVVVRFPAGPRVRLKTVDPPKGNGLGQKKVNNPVASSFRQHVGNAGTRYHIDSLCGCYSDNVENFQFVFMYDF